jgi:hypothetical protein
MKALLVSIEGTICDDRPRRSAGMDTPEQFQRQVLLQDCSVAESVTGLRELAKRYAILYLGNRPPAALAATQEWLARSGFPAGRVFVDETYAGRLALLQNAHQEFDLLGGIGCSPEDNRLHTDLGCLSFILPDCGSGWMELPERIERAHRAEKTRENEIHLRGKVEGLARVLPRLVEQYGESIWEVWMQAVQKLAVDSIATRRLEDLQSFAEHGLNPDDLRDAARWDMALKEEGWQDDPAYGLQEYELVEASERRYVHKVKRCYYAELWKEYGYPEIGYQIHCHTDQAWWDCPAWNPKVRFEQPKTLMRGDDLCLFVQYLPEE